MLWLYAVIVDLPEISVLCDVVSDAMEPIVKYCNNGEM